MIRTRVTGVKGHTPKKKVILIFGEDPNDCKSLKHLVQALKPNGCPSVETIRRPIILSQQAAPRKREAMCEEISKAVKAKNITSQVVSVIAHRDCDAVEPAHRTNSTRLLKDMRTHNLPQPVAATPAFEIEAWWFLWPGAVAKTRACWKSLKPPQYVGKMFEPQETIAADASPKRRKNELS